MTTLVVRTLEERMESAATFRQVMDWQGPLAADPMDNSTSDVYGSFPERAYIVHNGTVELVGQSVADGIWTEGLEEWLQEFEGKK